MKSLICALMLVVCTVVLQAQAPDTLWTRRYWTNGDDVPAAVKQVSDGGYIIAASSTAPGSQSEIRVIKTSGLGAIEWTRTFAGADPLSAADVIATSNGEYVVVGNATYGTAWSRVYVAWLSAGGDSISARMYGNECVVRVNRIVELPGAELLLLGSTSQPSQPRASYEVCLTEDGDTLWTRTGYRQNELPIASHWSELADAYMRADFEAVAVYNVGGYWCCDPMGHPNYSFQYSLQCYSAEGDTIWRRPVWSLPDHVQLWGHRICRTPLGTIYSVSQNHHTGWMDVARTSPDGETGWIQALSQDTIVDIAPGADDGFTLLDYVTGADNDIRFTGCDSEGNVVWTEQFWWNESQVPVAVEWAADSGYVLAATTGPAGQARDILIVKTEPVRSLYDANQHTPLPQDYTCAVFPNPFNAATTLSFSLPRASEVTLAVYDVTGRLAATLAQGRKDAGEHVVTFDGAALPSGLYFARLTAGEFTRTQKMVLLK